MSGRAFPPARTEAANATAGVFTTRKLKALIDARLAPGVYNRRTLGEVLRAGGAAVSLHAIDAWFKHRDGNYAFERTSLDPRQRSYALPGRHVPLLLRIFRVDAADLALDDDAFREHCRRLRADRERRAVAAGRRVVFVNGLAADKAAVSEEIYWLCDNGFEILDATFVDSVGSDWPLLRRLDAAHVVLHYVSAGSARSRGWCDVVDFANASGLPVVVVRLDDFAAPPRGCAGAPVLSPSGTPRTRYRSALADALRQQARDPAARTPVIAWPPPSPISDRPSIAVLPFTNLTGDPAVEQLGDSIAEGVITLLSRIPEFFVIARSTTQAYARQRPDNDVIRRQLGVRYVLEGTLRSDGRRLRVTAQLVETESGSGVWSQRFDRSLDDLFDVQDDITLRICAELEPKVRLADIDYGSRTGDQKAWRLWEEGWYLLFADAPSPMPERSLGLFRQALELEPDYPLAHAGIAVAYATGVLWGGLPAAYVERAVRHAEIACKRLPENPVVLYALGMTTFLQPVGMEVPLAYVRRAVELEPSNAMYQAVYGYLVANLGQPEEGVERCLRATRLSPKDAREPFLCYMLGNAYIANGEYEKAIATMLECRRFSDADFIWLMTAFAHFQLGAEAQALECLRSIRQPRPYRFYEYSVLHRLWLSIAAEAKQAFLALLPAAGIDPGAPPQRLRDRMD
jgi:TolB-like protein